MCQYYFLVLFFLISKNLFGASFLEYCNSPEKYPAEYKTIKAIFEELKTDKCEYAFKSLSFYEFLNITGNDIETIKPIVEFNNLKKLSLKSNKSIDLKGISSFTNLESFRIECPDISLDKIKSNSIIWMYLYSNNFSKIKNFENFTSLKWIELYNFKDNKIFFDLEVLSKNSSLRNIYLENFKVYNLISISKIKLQKFSLYSSKLRNPENLIHLKNIESLSLQDASLINLDFLYSFKKLELLNISDNKGIKDFNPIKSLIKLDALYLNDLDLDGINFLPQSKHLRVVRASNNNIENIDILATFPEIFRIVFHNNRIKKIPDFTNTSIEYIWMNNNNIDHLPKLPNSIIGLLVSNNRISDFLNLNSIPNVVDLRIAGNKIKNLDVLKDFEKIMYFDISGSKIQDISPIANNKKMFIFIAANNNISDIEVLSSLELLDLVSMNNNKVQDVSSLKELMFLSEIHINENPLGTTIEKTDQNCPVDAKSKALTDWCKEKFH